MIHILTPYRTDKDLGKAYNDACALIPKGDWICLMDIDCMFLTPDAPELMQKYVDKWPETGVFTALCNRVSPLSFEQLWGGKPSNDADMLHHIEIAQLLVSNNPTVKPLLRGEISGYLMLFSRETWEQNPFDEGIGCLAVDTFWSRRIVASGKDIKVMQNIYVWHTYRIWKSITDKTHLF